MDNSITYIARTCHEANRAYCQSLGDNSQQPWEQSPEWQQSSALNGVHFHLTHLRKGQNAPPSASHDSWLEQKRVEGWKFGPIKDAEKKEHPCFIKYGELPVQQKAKDYLFAAIVKAFYDSGMIQ